MKKLNFPIKFKHYLFVFFSCFIFNPNLSADNIDVIKDDDWYIFKVTSPTLGPEDLVYLRFSDGTHLKATAVETDGGMIVAEVGRYFNSEGEIVDVIGYVAKKGGPLELIGSTTVTVSPCPNCFNPTILAANEKVKLEASWGLFTSDEDLEVFEDDAVHPTFPTPETPWILLNAAIKSTQQNPFQTLEISIPAYLNVRNIIIEDEMGWGTFTPVSSDFCQSVTVEGNIVTVHLNANYIGNANVYVLVEGYPDAFEGNMFKAELNGKDAFLGKDDIVLLASHNPHDPNVLHGEEPWFCPGQSQPEKLAFRIDFQNLGEGVAENVMVVFFPDDSVMDPGSYQIIGSSNAITSVEVSSDYIKFNFTGINLPGLGQDYPYPQVLPVEATKGWVRFTMDLQACAPTEIEHIYHSGEIIFDCPSCGPNGYQEFTPLNEVEHKNTLCGIDPACIYEPGPTPGGGGKDIVLGGNSLEEASTQKLKYSIYPTIFDHELILSIEESTLHPIQVQLIDINGRSWYNHTRIATDLNTQLAINTANLPAGIFILRIQHVDKVYTQKVIKR